MCGEHPWCALPWHPEAGSSPHVRGAPHKRTHGPQARGIIPACAGSTASQPGQFRMPRDHPRMCWATLAGPRDHPRMCGEHCHGMAKLLPKQGIIPACAGSTCTLSCISCTLGDHPRMCGEHHDRYHNYLPSEGSSPHVRGAPHDATVALNPSGIIPAYAGSTIPTGAAPLWRRDHPRMCGEHVMPLRWPAFRVGSSPHVRGAPRHQWHHLRQQGIIPACAGSTFRASWTPSVPRDHPRMCGEHSLDATVRVEAEGSSPHVRGAHESTTDDFGHVGIIPACAGSTRSLMREMFSSRGSSPHVRGAPASSVPSCSSGRDHPRMCGEHYVTPPEAARAAGSSPHVRGAPEHLRSRGRAGGIIPACAGSTS